jgi:ABC-type nitrate/sulfonate/bicarbonate transport system substrate-binding protein
MFWHFGKSVQLTPGRTGDSLQEQGAAMIRLRLAVATFACGLASSAAASAQDKTLEPLVINYTIPNAIWWNIDVAIDKGFLKDEGFAPEGTPFQISPQAVQLLVSKSVQVAVIQPEAVMDANLKGAGLAAIIQTETRPDWYLVAPSDSAGWSDIKGKNVGFSSLKVNEVWLTEKLLSAHGLGKADWTALQVGVTPLKFAALTKGSIAAAPLFQPGAQLAIKQGLKPLARYDELGDCPPSLIVVDKSWAAENKRGARFVRAVTRAHQWLYDAANRAEAEGILTKYTKVDPDIAHQVYEVLFITDKIYSRDGAIDMKGLKAALQLVADAGELRAAKLPDPESLILPVELGGIRR